MNRFRILQSVKTKPGTARGGDDTGQGAEAGHVSLIDPTNDDTVGVTWDTDGVQESIATADLIAL
ncbi:hypothetical protein [Polaromonas sp.]|uniref:hypothetical protein n=1 Tax=Polaromonas sp. TaxID=1869339 RepID=UPI003C7FAC59